jgi:hypothetical protein
MNMREIIALCESGSASIQNQVAQIENQFGVKIEIDVYDDDAVVLLNIDRLAGAPGSGAEAIRTLLAITDRQNLPVSLTAAEGHPKLVRYYLALGFQIPSVSPKRLKKWLVSHERQWDADHANDEDLEGVLMVRQPHHPDSG